MPLQSDFYARTSPSTRLLRWGMAASQRLWPTLAVRAAARLFGTPWPPRWLARRPPWAAGWRRSAWPFEGASLGLYEPADPAPGPFVLLVHGWGDHAAAWLPLAAALQARGLRPILLEMPAHGRSAGATSNLPQFARAIDYVCARLREQGRAPQAVVAHSLAANAGAYAASRGLDLARLVLLAPPASPQAFTRLFAQVFGLSETTRAAMQSHIEAREAVLMARFEPAAVGPRIGAATLVVHDRQDRVNRFADGQAYAQAIPGARLLATEGLGHRRLLKDGGVLQAVADFLA
ncbi:alpha/beta fold hydrolase [Ramlibacter sp. 2FC]|uniref:alpha/beta hydrolase n=1 Tax=Ramlibacter sp. 2FC TaxID=2502188 RepID=UPI0010F44FC8|nr:alpha/beta fold hydrolase [Ramlibacter sp. 2FC]